MKAIAKSERVIYQWTGFHAALSEAYLSDLGDMVRDLCRLATTGLIWIHCSRCKIVWCGPKAAVSMKDLASEAKWLRRSWAGVRLGACLG